MEPRLDVRQQRDRGQDAHAVSSASPDSQSSPRLEGQALRVFECLMEATTGLTAGQIEARLSCEPGSLQETLDSLVQSHLVSRLNTVIPSYCCRVPSAGVHAL